MSEEQGAFPFSGTYLWCTCQVLANWMCFRWPGSGVYGSWTGTWDCCVDFSSERGTRFLKIWWWLLGYLRFLQDYVCFFFILYFFKLITEWKFLVLCFWRRKWVQLYAWVHVWSRRNLVLVCFESLFVSRSDRILPNWNVLLRGGFMDQSSRLDQLDLR